MMKKIGMSLLFLMTMSVFSQQKIISDYKYIIVLDRFDFLKTSDQYQTSSLTKFLLQKKGFTVFLSTDKFPQDLLQNRCLALTARVSDASGILTVKNKIELNDCYGRLLYSSQFGKSKEKDYKKAYHEAIRKAYASMTDLESTAVIDTEEVLEKKEGIPNKTRTTNLVKQEVALSETLNAQTTKNGFLLVNKKSRVVYQLLQTDLKEVFVIKEVNGIFYKKDTFWIAEYYENNQLIQKAYQVIF